MPRGSQNQRSPGRSHCSSITHHHRSGCAGVVSALRVSSSWPGNEGLIWFNLLALRCRAKALPSPHHYDRLTLPAWSPSLSDTTSWGCSPFQRLSQIASIRTGYRNDRMPNLGLHSSRFHDMIQKDGSQTQRCVPLHPNLEGVLHMVVSRTPNMTDYEAERRSFHLEVPEYFNFATDVIGKWASDPRSINVYL